MKDREAGGRSRKLKKKVAKDRRKESKDELEMMGPPELGVGGR